MHFEIGGLLLPVSILIARIWFYNSFFLDFPITVANVSVFHYITQHFFFFAFLLSSSMEII